MQLQLGLLKVARPKLLFRIYLLMSILHVFVQAFQFLQSGLVLLLLVLYLQFHADTALPPKLLLLLTLHDQLRID